MKLKLIGLIAFLIVIIIGLFYILQSEKQKSDRLYSNLNSIVNVNNQLYTKLVLKTNELKSIYPKIDSIAKANNIKPKNIEKIIIYDHKTIYDTIKYKEPISIDSTNRVIIAKAFESCFISEGVIDLRNTKLYPTDNDVSNILFSLQNTIVIDKGELMYYWKRDTTRLFRFWPFAKKKYYSKGVSECNGEIKVQEIIFKK